MRGLVEANPNLLIPHYLIHSWLYYERDLTVISDVYYDKLCHDLMTKLPTLSHPHKYLVEGEALRAGTAYHLRDRYPAIVEHAASRLYWKFNPKKDLRRKP